MTSVVTVDECLDAAHLKVMPTQHALGWLEGGAHMGRVLKDGENIKDREMMGGGGH